LEEDLEEVRGEKKGIWIDLEEQDYRIGTGLQDEGKRSGERSEEVG